MKKIMMILAAVLALNAQATVISWEIDPENYNLWNSGQCYDIWQGINIDLALVSFVLVEMEKFGSVLDVLYDNTFDVSMDGVFGVWSAAPGSILSMYSTPDIPGITSADVMLFSILTYSPEYLHPYGHCSQAFFGAVVDSMPTQPLFYHFFPPQTIPEPATGILALAGGAALFSRRRRKSIDS